MKNTRGSNVKFIYLYRDASNYKNWGEVIFANPDGVQLEEIGGRLGQFVTANETFIASQVRIPEVFLFPPGDPTMDDHCFHEFASVETTDEPATDESRRSILEFTCECASAAASGWLGFDPERPDRQFVA